MPELVSDSSNVVLTIHIHNVGLLKQARGSSSLHISANRYFPAPLKNALQPPPERRSLGYTSIADLAAIVVLIGFRGTSAEIFPKIHIHNVGLLKKRAK